MTRLLSACSHPNLGLGFLWEPLGNVDFCIPEVGSEFLEETECICASVLAVTISSRVGLGILEMGWGHEPWCENL